MKFSAEPIMEIAGEEFKVLSYTPLFRLQNNEVFFNKDNLQSFLAPLSSKNFTDGFIKTLEVEIKKYGPQLFRIPSEVSLLAFKSRGIKYKIYLHKEEDTVFGYLLYKLIIEKTDIKNKKTMKYSPNKENPKCSDSSNNKKTLH